MLLLLFNLINLLNANDPEEEVCMIKEQGPYEISQLESCINKLDV